MSAPVTPWPPETPQGQSRSSRKEELHEQETPAKCSHDPPRHACNPGGLAGRPGVKRIANLLGNEPAAIALDIGAISARLAAANPVAVGLTAKNFCKCPLELSGGRKGHRRDAGQRQIPGKPVLSPAWSDLFQRLSGRRAHIGSPASPASQAPAASRPRRSMTRWLATLSRRFARGPFAHNRLCCAGR